MRHYNVHANVLMPGECAVDILSALAEFIAGIPRTRQLSADQCSAFFRQFDEDLRESLADLPRHRREHSTLMAADVQNTKAIHVLRHTLLMDAGEILDRFSVYVESESYAVGSGGLWWEGVQRERSSAELKDMFDVLGVLSPFLRGYCIITEVRDEFHPIAGLVRVWAIADGQLTGDLPEVED